MARNDGPSLREYVERLFADHQRAHAEHNASHRDAHEFTESAVKTAESLAQQNKEDANEWRGAMNDRERLFVPRPEIEALEDRINKLEAGDIRDETRDRLEETAKMARNEAERDRRRREQIIWGVAVGLASIIINLFLRLLSAASALNPS